MSIQHFRWVRAYERALASHLGVAGQKLMYAVESGTDVPHLKLDEFTKLVLSDLEHLAL